MIDISNAEAALLGLLTEGEKHPYLIEQEVRDRDMRYWTELSMSQIYKSLHRLEKSGLVECHPEIGPANRTRLVYRITDNGKDALRDKFAALLSEPEHIRWGVDVAFYNLGFLSREEQLCLLAFYRTALEKRIVQYRDLEEFMTREGCPTLHKSISSRPRYLWQAEIAWIDDLIANLKEES